MMGNPKFGAVGFISYMYFLLYELLSPFIEVFGVVTMASAFFLDLLNLPFMLLFMLIYEAYNSILTLTAFFSRIQTIDLTVTLHDFYMFELACRQLEKWKGTAFENIALSCNFTRITLSEENFIDKLRMISNSFTFDKSKIAIEITEDAMEKDRETATNNVKLCKEIGFRVYLDDLGSGYTSLANLCDYPIDVVKIDRDILLKTKNKKGKDLFAGIVALAHSLNIKVICEGVETEKNKIHSYLRLLATSFRDGIIPKHFLWRSVSRL